MRVRTGWERHKPRLVGEQHPTTLEDVREVNDITNTLYQEIDSLVTVNERAMFVLERRTRHYAGMMLWGTTGALVLAAVALGTFSLMAARRISEPLVEVSSRLHQALNPTSPDSRFGAGAVDEIALLGEELDKLLQRLARYDDEQRRRLSHMQSRLAFVINEVLEGLLLIDGQGRIVAVNRVAREILGLRACAGITRTNIAQDSPRIPRRRRWGVAGTTFQGGNEGSRGEDKRECSGYFCAGPNIVGNALRYTDRGGRIVVAIREARTHFTVEISDTGRGIPEEDLAHIFEPYVMLDDEPEPGTDPA